LPRCGRWRRRERDLADGVLVAAVSRARGHLDLLTGPLDPATYGELVRFGTVLPWHDGTPPRQRDRLLTW
jgi:hypothetical protein